MYARSPCVCVACCFVFANTNGVYVHVCFYKCRFITCFVTMFAVVIAITKDLPDVEGDKANGIETFATKMGVPAVSLGGELHNRKRTTQHKQ